jgi:hypothetical protein
MRVPRRGAADLSASAEGRLRHGLLEAPLVMLRNPQPTSFRAATGALGLFDWERLR